MIDVRQELVEFFGWRYEDVLKLNRHELQAWAAHFEKLKEVGFYFRQGAADVRMG